MINEFPLSLIVWENPEFEIFLVGIIFCHTLLILRPNFGLSELILIEVNTHKEKTKDFYHRP
jgi:hypothetical protein